MSEIDTWVAEHGYNPNPFGGGQDVGGGLVFVKTNPADPDDASGTLYYNGVQIGFRDYMGKDTYLPSTILSDIFGSTGGGGGGGGISPESYALQQQEAEMTQRHYYISDSLAAQQEDRLRITDTWQRAVNEGNLALAREQEQRLAANEAQTLALKQQQQALDAALGQAQVGANVYGTQTQGRSSQLATLADFTKAAAEAQANPWNPLGYLDNVVAAGGGTPFSNMTPTQNTAYGNQMAQNWQNTFGGVGQQIQQSLAQTYQTPDAITAAMQQAQPWYMGTSNYNAASPNQQAIFRGLQPGQQTALAGATPEQMAALARMGQPAVNPALARYQTSTAGEKKALAGATPEQLKRLWEAGQVR